MSTQPLRGGGAADGRGETLSASALPAAAAAGEPAAPSASTPPGGAATSGGAAQAQPPQPAALRLCGLPSCGLAEAAALDFRVCALCNVVAYCCEAHSAVHWRAGHKRECGGRTRAAAQLPLAADGAGSASTPPGGTAAGDGAASASPSASAVAHPPLPPPSPEDVATLHALVEKYAEKAALRRDGRAAELAGQAADLAFRLYGSDSLVGVSLRLRESDALRNAFLLEPHPGPVQSSLFSRSCVLLLASISVIEHRMAAGTLLLGACREVETQFEARLQAALLKAYGAPPLHATHLRILSTAVGYDTCVHAAFGVLNAVHGGWPAAQRLRCQAFVLAALGTVPRTAALATGQPGGELMLVHFVAQDFERLCSRYEPSFHAAVRAGWTSPVVVNVLRTRGSLEHGAAYAKQQVGTVEALQKEDVAARGFRRCGLPSCGKLETTVRHFKLCGGCDAVAYCCDEHHGAHWDDGHSRECRHLRAAGARPPSTLDG